MTGEKSTDTLRVDDGLLSPGTLLNERFRIVRKLAEGGMGHVYVAVQEPIGRQVALKVMRKELVSDEMSAKRFLREAVAVSKLHHPNTITVLDYGEAPGHILYIAMEYLEGESLHELLDREGGLSLEVAVSIVSQIARSLAEAHSKGVIHRDLKPENIFISHVKGEGLFVQVLDFGIAKLQQNTGTRITRMGYVCGTPEYMSPEQARGDELEGTSDLYALGVMLWEMLSGKVPYDSNTPLGVVLKHQNDPIPPIDADVPESLKAFVYQVMSKDHRDRPQNAEEFLRALDEACPKDMSLSPGRGRVTGPRRSLIGPTSTPPAPMYNTKDVAMLPTKEVSVEELVDLDAPLEAELPGEPTRGRFNPGLVTLIAIACLLGVAVVVLALDNASDQSPIAAPAPEPVTVRLEVDPSGTTVFLNGESKGLAPMNLRGLPGQEVELELGRQGYQTFKTNLTFPDKPLTTRKFNLWPRPRVATSARISLETTPPGAMLVRDGHHLGKAPHAFDLHKEDAPFKVEVRLAGYETREALIDPIKGTHTMSLHLNEVEEKNQARPDAQKKPPTRVRPPSGQRGNKAPPARKLPVAEKKAPVEKPAEAPPRKKVETRPDYKIVE